jgi:ADP-heptose:LPS heptosyltransferase
MVSRAKIRDVYNAKRFAASWQGVFLKGDRYFSRHLSSEYDDYVPEAEPTTVVHVGHPVIARDAVKRLLVVKLDHIGDFIASLPAMRRLKQLFPKAELHVLAARASMSLAALEPAIDQMHEFNFFNAKSAKGTLKLAQKELVALRERLAPFHFDLALDLRRQPDTRHVLQYTGATWTGGFDRSYQHPWLDLAVDWEGDLARHSKRAHIGDALLQFVEAIGVSCGNNRHVIAKRETMDEARALIAELPAVAAIGPVLFQRRLVCVHPGSGNENKQWPPGHFAGLIDLLVEDQNANIVMIGGPDEVAVAEEVLDSVIHQDRVFMLVGKTRLGDLGHVLRACELYVGNDSGPKHMAAALGVPTIGIHSGTVDAGEWGPMGETAVALRRDMTCSPCYLSRIADCHRNLACMRGLKPGDVYRACVRLLALGRPDTAETIVERRAEP